VDRKVDRRVGRRVDRSVDRRAARVERAALVDRADLPAVAPPEPARDTVMKISKRVDSLEAVGLVTLVERVARPALVAE
jgi:hypothetical protein